jgi:hypothetical protein
MLVCTTPGPERCEGFGATSGLLRNNPLAKSQGLQLLEDVAATSGCLVLGEKIGSFPAMRWSRGHGSGATAVRPQDGPSFWGMVSFAPHWPGGRVLKLF